MKSIFIPQRTPTNAEGGLSFRREVPMSYLDVMIPTKTGRNQAQTFMAACYKDKCIENRLIPTIKEVIVSSEDGIAVDIESPHEMTFLFDGKPECEYKGDKILCKTGKPITRDFDPNGEFVDSFETDKIELKNIPYRDLFFVETIMENASNHWYFKNMKDDVYEINITPEKITEVKINLRHPMLTSAQITLNEKNKCEVLADAEWIRERRKLYCL